MSKNNEKKRSIVKELINAVRPWSLTQVVVGMLLTAQANGTPIFSVSVLLASIMGLCIQSGANLTNTYFDFKSGVDSIKYKNSNPILEGGLSSNAILLYSIFCYVVGTLAILPTLYSESFRKDADNFYFFIGIFAVQIWLAYGYTGDPFRFKYRALGDVCGFLCFGPLVMSVGSYMISEKLPSSFIHYTILMGSLAEAILHMNNIRDIANDKEAQIVTVAIILGYRGSFLFFLFLIFLIFGIGTYISLYEHAACGLIYLTIPKIMGIIKQAYNGNFTKKIVENTTLFQLYFGVAVFIGLVISEKGLLAMI